MAEEKMLTSKSETIGVADIRRLKELERTLDPMLTREELVIIASVYDGVINRLLKENGEN